MPKDYTAFFRQHLKRDATAEDQIRILERLFGSNGAPIATNTRQLVRIDPSRDLTDLLNDGFAGAGLETSEEKIEEAILAIKEEEEKKLAAESKPKRISKVPRVMSGIVLTAEIGIILAAAVVILNPPNYTRPNELKNTHNKASIVDSLATSNKIPARPSEKIPDIPARTLLSSGVLGNHDYKLDPSWNLDFAIEQLPNEISAEKHALGWIEGSYEVSSKRGLWEGLTTYHHIVSFYRDVEKRDLEETIFIEAADILKKRFDGLSFEELPNPEIEKSYGFKSAAYKITLGKDRHSFAKGSTGYLVAYARADCLQMDMVLGSSLDYPQLLHNAHMHAMAAGEFIPRIWRPL